MSIARDRDEPRKEPTAELVIEPPSYQGTSVDSVTQTSNSISTYQEGRPWTVDYYKHRLGRQDELKAFSVDIPVAYQSYKEIRGFELRVTQDLTWEQNTNSKDMIGRGAANVYGIMIPNEQEIFRADAGDGREGLFSVTSSNRKSIQHGAVHEIEYVMLCYVDQAIADNLKTKALEIVYFSKDYMRRGLNPFLRPEDMEIRSKLAQHYDRLIGVYFHDFFSNELSTLLVPGQPLVTYDPFLPRFLLQILQVEDHANLRRMKCLNVSSAQASYDFTIWHVLEELDSALLTQAADRVGVITKNWFRNNKFSNSIYFTKVEGVVWPLMNTNNVDAHYFKENKPKTASKIVRGHARLNELDRLIPITELIMDTSEGPFKDPVHPEVPNIRRVAADEYYVFTKAFYRHDYPDQQPLSRLEAITLSALKGEAMNLKVLNELCIDALRWDNVEKFYYIPVLLLLLRIYPRSF